MKRVEKILEHPLYQSNRLKIERLEEERIFCRHGMEHSLDVARILYILVLERGIGLPKDIVYATALLHDIGRAVQYEAGTPHHQQGAGIAKGILRDCGYTEAETENIGNAIMFHQSGQAEDGRAGQDTLLSLLYRADKLSRNCFDCKAQQECYWKDEQRNRTVRY